MNLELLSDVVVSTEAGKTGRAYQLAEVNYKNLYDGKVASKKLLQFNGAYKVISNGKQGQRFTVTTEKNEKGYWDWTSAVVLTKDDFSNEATIAPVKTTPAPRSTYETQEERARKQVYIVRQSSITAALGLLFHNRKNALPINVNEVIEVARQFEAFVFDTNFADMESDEIE